MKSTSSIQHTLWLVIAVMAFFAMASSSPQCARSTDRVLDPVLTPLGAPKCDGICKKLHKVGARAERTQHRIRKRACNGDPACKAEANALHQLIFAELDADLVVCKAACVHNQGSASGGQ